MIRKYLFLIKNIKSFLLKAIWFHMNNRGKPVGQRSRAVRYTWWDEMTGNETRTITNYIYNKTETIGLERKLSRADFWRGGKWKTFSDYKHFIWQYGVHFCSFWHWSSMTWQLVGCSFACFVLLLSSLSRRYFWNFK